MAELSTLLTRLEEAETALHRLLTGKTVTVSDQAGRRVEYAGGDSGSVARLQAYIQGLKAEIATLTGSTGRRRPLSVRF